MQAQTRRLGSGEVVSGLDNGPVPAIRDDSPSLL